jgi:transcriptional regulator with XRE-family HTH domain
MLANRHDKPSMRVMYLISQACGVDPSYFAEYRLADARRQLDPAEVGLEHALANLNGAPAIRRRTQVNSRPHVREPRPAG